MFTLLAALLGALAGAWVAHIFAVYRENTREQRELLGLLQLVHVEVVNNLELLKDMGYSGNFHASGGRFKRGPDSLKAPRLSTEAWDQSRARIAALLKDEERIKHLVGGYAALRALKDRLLNPDTDSFTEQEHKDNVKQVTRHQWLSFDACKKETGMFWAYSKGMLVSKPAENFAGLEEGA